MNIMHWLQMVKRGTVAMYDYGTKENKKKYGQNPIYVYSGDEDWLADPQDISGYLMPRISHTVVQNTELHDYNHLDFIWGLRAAADIYVPIIEYYQEGPQLISIIKFSFALCTAQRLECCSCCLNITECNRLGKKKI
ncbi:hypothetical protein COOONC_20301 [Cooperia oncophora]